MASDNKIRRLLLFTDVAAIAVAMVTLARLVGW